MEVFTLTTQYAGSHSYLLIEKGHCVLIDIGDPDLVIKSISEKGIALDFCIITHEHCDHIFGCSKVKSAFGCKIYASAECNSNMGNSRRNFSHYYNAFVSVQENLPINQKGEMDPFIECADIVFSDELKLEWMGHSFVLHKTPGHSQGSSCILFDEQYLFSGDRSGCTDNSRGSIHRRH